MFCATKKRTPTLEQVNIVKKWTVSSAGMDKAALQAVVAKEKKPVAIFAVLALITNVKEAVSKLKSDKLDYRFAGQFEVTNLLTGAVIHSAEAYFPGAAEQHALNAFESARRNEGAAQAMAFTITVEKDDSKNSATGYKFGLIALVNKEASDPFAELRKALPAPKK